jgi:hypothetical protein
MLQPAAPKPMDITTAKIIWLALNGSILVYVFVLYHLGKMTGVWIPQEEIILIQKLGLASTFIIAGTFYFHSTKILGMKSSPEKFSYYIVAWALNESVVIAAFIGTFLSESGNGFFMLVNTVVTILANILMFPKEK